jgi:cytochrome c biogenesis protein CcdA/thiol-disulfide isomerase/thioredoxin
MLLLLGAFVAGILTVLAPCVLALLPVIIGGSVQGDVRDKRRPIIIAASLAISILFFTLLLKATSLLVAIDPRTITYISGGIIIAVGVLTLIPSIYARLFVKLGVEHRAVGALGRSFQNKSSLVGPIVTGAALGPVFSSCSPVYAYILATVLPVDFGQALAYIISYIIGLSLVMLLIGYYGQRFVSRIKFASDPKGWFQRAIAILFIIVGVLVATGYDKRFQTYVSQHTPFNFDALSSQLLPDSANKPTEAGVLNVKPYPAPEFVGFEDQDVWINSKPQSIEGLRGKVVLVDFWTYSCINCIRNNPYIEGWYQKYKDQGFVVVGSHAPEFAFEKVKANVEKAVRDQKLTYPVALDNNLNTWAAFQNRSWPTAYLIDAEGQVRRVHEGEGEYDQTEQAIRQLLQEKGADLGAISATSGTKAPPVRADQTPETYLGLRRASNYSGTPALGAAPTSTFVHATNLRSNGWSLSGNWEVGQEKITARSSTTLRIKVSAKDVYLVAAAPDGTQSVGVSIDGQPQAAIKVGQAKLYRVASFGEFSRDKIIELTVPAGVELNAFTYGS